MFECACAEIKAHFIKIAEKAHQLKIARRKYFSEKLRYYSLYWQKPAIIVHIGPKKIHQERGIITEYGVQEYSDIDQPTNGEAPCTL